MAPRRIPLSLVLGGLEETLTAEEWRARKRDSALFRGSRPGLTCDVRGMAQHWAQSLVPLIAGRRVVIVMPAVACLDRETIFLCRALLRHRSEGLRFVIGYDPEFQPQNRLRSLTLEPVLRELTRLEALDGTEVHTILEGAAPGEVEAAPEPVRTDPLDDDVEWDAWQMLTAGAAEGAHCDLLLRAARRACAAFGFAEALELAHGTLGLGPTPAEAHELHRIAGLAACHAGGSPGLAKLAEAHLSAALDKAVDPAQRAPLQYHLASLNKDAARAQELADRLLATTRERGLSAAQAVISEIAARKLRAAASYAQDQLVAASLECQIALDLLGATERNLDLTSGELALLRWQLLSDRILYAHEGGDGVCARRCERDRTALEKSLPVSQVPSLDWLPSQLFNSNLAGAVADCVRRRSQARRDLEPEAEAYWAYLIGEISYRMGAADLALQGFQASMELWRQLQHPPEDVLAAELCCAMAALRAGRGDVAEARFESLRTHPDLAHAAGQAETLAALAMVAATRHDAQTAADRIQSAMRFAKECGFADAVVSVQRSAGEAYRILGQEDQSRKAFEQAMETVSHNGSAASSRFSLLMALPEDTDRTLEALQLLPQALDDANAWWDLAGLIHRVTKLAENGALSAAEQESADLKVAIGRLIEAGSQRGDCQRAVMNLVLTAIESAEPPVRVS
jgi:tetratricopeptide (TPR) repeat protein